MRVPRRWITGLILGSLAATAMPGVASALPYDGTNPAATICGDGSHPVYTLHTANILSAGGAVIGRVDLRHSAHCATVWSRVTNLTSGSLSSREKIIVYTDPHGAGGTTYTENDTLAAGQSGWSLQYRDRPSFRARGELLHGGAWRVGQTVLSLMWAQYDGNWPNLPNTCDDTVGDMCHRWRTNADGTPITLYYSLENMSLLDGNPEAEITEVLEKYEDLAGGSPSVALTIPDYEDVSIYAYSGPATDGWAYALSYFSSTNPQYYYYGYIKYNAGKAFTAGYRAVTCHEWGHILGLMHITTGSKVGSKATCMGADYTGPYIDDVTIYSKIYSTPLAN